MAGRKSSRPALLVLGVLALLPVNRAAAQEGTLLRLHREVPGRVTGLVQGDLDGDGRTDLLVSFSQADSSGQRSWRRLIPLFQEAEGTWSDGDPWPVPESAVGFDLAPGDTARPPLILFLRAEGLTAHRILHRTGWAARPAWGAHINPVPANADPHNLPPMPLALPVVPGLYLVPTAQSMDLIRVEDDSTRRLSRLLSPPQVRMGEDGAVALTLTRWHTGRFNGDDRTDLLLITGEAVDCYLRLDNAAPQGRPPNLRYKPGLRPLQPSALASWGEAALRLQVADFNGDGLEDLVAVRAPRARFLTDQCQIQLYTNRGGRWPQAPDQVLTADHFGGHVSLADFNGDGRTDLVVTRFSTGLGQLLRYLLTRRVQMGCDLYFQGVDGRFASQPDVRFNYTRALDPGRLPKEADASVVVADLDGDGCPDLVAPTGPRQWTAFYGSPHKPLGGRRETLDACGDGKCLACDLDGDGRTDLVIWGHDGSAPSTVDLFLSRGGTP